MPGTQAVPADLGRIKTRTRGQFLDDSGNVDAG
jgi:hypothetical protein